ncbi:MAG: hypothetical protein PVG49_13035, partial [Desulfobacteraceae bacterium]
MDQKLIEREELYKMVWKTPVTKVAAEYGISDVALKKICKKLNVPTPPMGYWAKVQNGVRTNPPPRLPKINRNAPRTHVLRGKDQGRHKEKKILENIEIPYIKVPKVLTNPHPLIHQTYQILKDKQPNEYGLIKPNEKCLHIYVGPDSLKRSLLIMNALFREIEKGGNEIITNSWGKEPRTGIKIGESIISIKLKEKSRNVSYALTNRENQFIKRYPANNRLGRYRSIPDGTLCLSIETYVAGKKQWYDSKRKNLEKMVGDFYAGLFA